jgi:hypothetical protein
MADSREILPFQREQFLVPLEENIQLSRIANGYEETGDEEQQHVEEMEEEMEEVLNLPHFPKIAGYQPVWKNNPNNNQTL